MTPEARKKLRDLAMAATQGERKIVMLGGEGDDPSAVIGVRRPYLDTGVFSVLCEVPTRSEDRKTIDGIALAEDDAAYIAAAHPGVMLELLDALEKAEKRAERLQQAYDAAAFKVGDHLMNGTPL